MVCLLTDIIELRVLSTGNLTHHCHVLVNAPQPQPEDLYDIAHRICSPQKYIGACDVTRAKVAVEVSRNEGDLYLVTRIFRICSGFPRGRGKLSRAPPTVYVSRGKFWMTVSLSKVTRKLEKAYKIVGKIGVPHMHPTILITYINCGRACCSGVGPIP